jgi:Glyoxalase-like domain
VRAQFDHLVVAIRSLPEGIAQFERLTAVRAAIGGVHPNRGTENALVSLGPGAYLEIIAPQSVADLSPRDAAMRAIERLRIVSWAVAVDDVVSAAEALDAGGFATTPPQSGSRVTPSGERLEWTVFTLNGERSPAAPFFIRWSSGTRHPSATAPGGCALEGLTVRDPDADRLAAALGALDMTGITILKGKVSMEATLTCAGRTVTLAGSPLS